jgi:hypothetical protein
MFRRRALLYTGAIISTGWTLSGGSRLFVFLFVNICKITGFARYSPNGVRDTFLKLGLMEDMAGVRITIAAPIS